MDQLKHMQDVIGDWHDWLKLTQRAEQLFGGVRDSALVAMLRNVTQAKFRQSVDAVAETRASLFGKKSQAIDAAAAPARKPSTESASCKRGSGLSIQTNKRIYVILASPRRESPIQRIAGCHDQERSSGSHPPRY